MIRCILNKATDPVFNLALEEVLLTKTEGSFFLLQKNAPCLIIGKHQNIFREIHLREVALNHLPALRRISGGGTVYHDLGNLNFSFITGANPNWVGSNTLLQPMIEALKKLGIEVNFLGKTHLGVKERKISGNAQAIVKKRMLHHGTLLYQTDLQRLKKYLQLSRGTFEDRAVNSEPRPVANISFLTDATMEEVETELALTVSTWWKQTQNGKASAQREDQARKSHGSALFHTILPTEQNLWPSLLGQDLWEEIQRLATEKYRSWEWNYGYPMSSRYTKTRPAFGQDRTLHAKIENGRFRETKWTTEAKKRQGESTSLRRAQQTQAKRQEIDSIDMTSFDEIERRWAALLDNQPWEYPALRRRCQAEPYREDLLAYLF